MQHAAKGKQNVKIKEEEREKKEKRIRNIQIKREPSAFFRIVLMAPAYVRVQYLESRIRGVVVIVVQR